MGGMDLIFTPVLVRRLIGPPGLSGPVTGTSWTHSYSKRSNWVVWPASGFPPVPAALLPARPPPRPPAPPPPPPPAPLYVQSMILQ